MEIQIQPVTVHKRFPLTISRGTSAENTNLWVTIAQDDVVGWGEATPFSIGTHPQTTEAIAQALQQVIPALTPLHPLERQQIERILQEAQLPSAAQAAVDVALHDWLGKKVGLPLWRLWGLSCDRIPPTSVTIGINSPEGAQQRAQAWLNFAPVQALKIKLGNPIGIEADQAMFLAVRAIAPPNLQLSVDANGGWTLKDALYMSQWLAEHGVTYLEQPLARGQEVDLPFLYERSPLPIFADESCFTSRDMPALSDRVHGINIKLMKCGGLSEALRMVHTAQACGLQIMFGCYSDSGLSNTAAAQLTAFATHVDLDSHLNLIDDPFVGATLHNGCLLPNDLPGLGVTYAPHA